MNFKILTLNVWRYYQWKKRKRKIINFLKGQDANIIFLQEAAYDARLKGKWENQVHEINEKMGYPTQVFGRLVKMTKWHGKPIDWLMYLGLGIISKYPIKQSEIVVLPGVEKNKRLGFLHAVLETPAGKIDVINVHFENTNAGSKEHLKKTLRWCRQKNIHPIIAGDFNMKLVEDLIGIANKEYHVSYSLQPYKSFLPTKFSHNDKPVTLDYIIASKNRFEIERVSCIHNNVSDHKPVIAILKTK